MAEVQTDLLGFAAALNTSRNVVGTDIEEMLINDISRFGFSNTITPNDPITVDRQNFRGKETSRTSGAGFESRFHIDLMRRWIAPFCYSTLTNERITSKTPSAVTGSAYTVASITTALPENTLIWAQGFANSSNNGLKVVGSGGSPTSIPVSGLSAEASPVGRIYPGGFRLTGNKTWTYTAGTMTAVLTYANTAVSSLPVKGQNVHIGSATATGAAQNGLAANVYGEARVVSVSNTQMVLDKLDPKLRVAVPTVMANVDLRFGNHTANVARTDPKFRSQFVTFETSLPGLGDGVDINSTNTNYAYSLENRPGDMGIAVASESLVNVTGDFEGRDTSEESITRDHAFGTDTPFGDALTAAGGSRLRGPILTDTVSTTTGIPRLRIDQDQAGLFTDVLDATLTIGNNVSGTPAVGHVGSRFLNLGNFTTAIAMDLSYTDNKISRFINQSTVLSFDTTLRSDDGWFAIDVPSFFLSSEGPTFTRGEIVRISGTANAFKSPVFGCSSQYSIGYGSLPE